MVLVQCAKIHVDIVVSPRWPSLSFPTAQKLRFFFEPADLGRLHPATKFRSLGSWVGGEVAGFARQPSGLGTAGTNGLIV